MTNFIREICRIIYYSSKIIYNTLKKSLNEELQLSNELARHRYQGNRERLTDGTGMSLEEAMKILNVNKLDRHQVDEQYKHLFQANEKSQGGSFYLQSKVFRAKERVDLELSKTTNNNITT